MILAAFRRALDRHGMVRRGERVLVAVSGGADSVCLLKLFLARAGSAPPPLAVAHVNHRLRGRDSEEDARFVRRLAARHRLPFFLRRSAAAPRRKGLSLQESCREERLAFLLDTARREGFHRVALGHNADDQAETLLLRLLSEGGPAGLGGIPPVSHGGRVIHPLLGIRRRDIEQHLLSQGAAWRIDRSNASPAYLRNRLRLRLLPLLAAEYNPRIVERLGAVASLLRRDGGLLEEMSRGLLGATERRGGRIFFPSPLLGGHPALLSRALLSALRTLAPPGTDIGRRHLEALMEEGATGRFRVFSLPGGVTASRDRRGLALFAPGSFPAPPAPFDVPLPAPGSAGTEGGRVRVTAAVRRKGPSFDPSAMTGLPWRAALDRQRLALPLRIRSRRPGDRFRPLGMPSEKKLKEVLIDCRVPLPLRDHLPLVCDREGIVWVPGVRPAHRCRVTASTGTLLLLRAELDLDAIP